MLTSLLSNAAKYGAPETPIRIGVERRSGEVLVAVENEGKGIAPDELPGLFARYCRSRRRKNCRSLRMITAADPRQRRLAGSR